MPLWGVYPWRARKLSPRTCLSQALFPPSILRFVSYTHEVSTMMLNQKERIEPSKAEVRYLAPWRDYLLSAGDSPWSDTFLALEDHRIDSEKQNGHQSIADFRGTLAWEHLVPAVRCEESEESEEVMGISWERRAERRLLLSSPLMEDRLEENPCR